MKILFFDTKPYDRQFFDQANAAFGFDIKYLKNRLTPDTASLTEGYDAVCAFVNDDLSTETCEILKKNGVKLIAMRCAGYNNVDLQSVYEQIRVMRVPAYSPYAVSEHTVALMLSLNRKTHRAYYRTRDNNFAINGLLGFDMHGKTAGIIGSGKIGRLVAETLRGFGMNIVAYDRFPNEAWAKEQKIEYVELEELYARSDIITLHCPLTDENHHMLDKDAFAKMKDGVMIINTGRGALIHSTDLIDALKSGKVGSAGLDVYEEEDAYFFEDVSSQVMTDDTLARLLSFPNVLITAHQAFFTQEALTNIAETTLQNVRDFEEGGPLKNEVCYQCDKDSCAKETRGRCF